MFLLYLPCLTYSTLTPHLLTLKSMPMLAAHHTKNIERHRTDFFLVRTFDECGRGGERVVIHREQVKAYFDHDRALRFKDNVALDTPVGYHLFRESYSREAKSTARFAFCEVDESRNIKTVTPGPPPIEQEVLSDGGYCQLPPMGCR